MGQPHLQEYAEEVARVGVGAVRRGPRARFQVRLHGDHSRRVLQVPLPPHQLPGPRPRPRLGKPPFFAPFTGRGTRPRHPRPPAPSRPSDAAQASASRIKNARQRRGKGRSYTCHKKESLFTAPASMYCFLCLEIHYHP